METEMEENIWIKKIFFGGEREGGNIWRRKILLGGRRRAEKEKEGKYHRGGKIMRDGLMGRAA